jgi:hypothetical protein
MSDEIKYPWQQLLLDAFLTPSEFLPSKIIKAERAIADRLKDEPDVSERLALIDALNALRVLMGETLPKPVQREERKKDIA